MENTKYYILSIVKELILNNIYRCYDDINECYLDIYQFKETYEWLGLKQKLLLYEVDKKSLLLIDSQLVIYKLTSLDNLKKININEEKINMISILK